MHLFSPIYRIPDPLLKALHQALPAPAHVGKEVQSSLNGQMLLQVALTSPSSALISSAPLALDRRGWRYPLQFEQGFPPITTDRAAPSRAYMKLAEALALLHVRTVSSALDLGAAPGGWTSHLLSIGAQEVHSVDRY